MSSKLHLLVDALGQLVRVVLTGGQAHDSTQGETLLEGQTAEHVIADKAYDTDRIRAAVIALGAVVVIPSHPRRQQPISYDKHRYRERHLIECFINRTKHFRRIATRYDKTATSFSAFFKLVATIIALR